MTQLLPMGRGRGTALRDALVSAREKLGLTLRDVAKKARLSHQSVYRLEQGTGGLDAAMRVMNALGFSKKEKAQLLAKRVEQMELAVAHQLKRR